MNEIAEAFAELERGVHAALETLNSKQQAVRNAQEAGG